MNCIIVDDEPIAREGIVNLLKQHKQCKIVATCKNILELDTQLQLGHPDVLFLDIEMPYTNGMSYLKRSDYTIPTIITTAYHQYAIEGYALDIVDYLVKPISQERFDKAIQKLTEFIAFKNFSSIDTHFIFLKIDKQIEKIYFDDILFIEAMRNYIIVHTKYRKLIHYSSISGMYEKLPKELFFRVHKSFILAINKISNINKNKIFVEQIEIPLSKNIKKELLNLISNKLSS
jgi:DNA-binding LytR/AlgR family response regulator